MANFYKDDKQAGQEVRREGQLGLTVPREYQPGQIYSALRGREYQPGQEASEYLSGRQAIATPQQAPASPATGTSEEDPMAYLRSRYPNQPAASTGQPKNEDEDLMQYLRGRYTETSVDKPASETQASGEGTFLGDMARSLGRGGIALGSGAYELVNLVTAGGLDSATQSAFGTSGTQAINNARQSLNKSDSVALQQQRAELEKAEGFWSSFGTVLSNPRLAGSMLLEMGPQMATVVVAARTVAARAFASEMAKQTAGKAATAQAVQAANAAASRAATMTVMGVNPALEAGMASSDVRSEVMTMAEVELQKSPQYQKLVAELGDTEEGRALARARLANDAATTAAIVVAPISAVSSLLFKGGVEGDLARVGVGKAVAEATGIAQKRGLKEIGLGMAKGGVRESGQESIEEGGAQFGQNVGMVASTADPDRSLSEGVRQAAGAGGALGLIAGAGGNFRMPSGSPEAAPASPGTTGDTQTSTTPGAPAGSPQNQSADGTTAPANITLPDEEFAKTMESPQAIPLLAALYDQASNDPDKQPDQPSMRQTQIQELARRYDPTIDLAESTPELISQGYSAIESAPAGFIEAFQNSIPAQVAKPSQAPLPPEAESLPEPNFSDPDSADAALASAEDLGIEPINQGSTDAVSEPQGGAPNFSQVPPADAGGAPDAGTVPTGFLGFRQELVANAQTKGVSVKDTDYLEAPVPAEIKAIGDALGVPIYGYRYTGKSKKLQMQKGISGASGIGINVNAKGTHLNVLGHEVYHELAKRDPAAAAQLTGLIQQYISEEGKAKYAAWLKTSNYDPANFDEEMAADVLGVMFTDPQFWGEVNEQNPTLLEKVLTIISGLIDRLKAGMNRDEMFTKRGRAMQGFIKDYDGVRKMLAQFVADNAKRPRAEGAVQEMADIDPAEMATQFAREGKKADAARAYRQADLYKQTGVPFEQFYAQAQAPTPAAAATPQQLPSDKKLIGAFKDDIQRRVELINWIEAFVDQKRKENPRLFEQYWSDDITDRDTDRGHARVIERFKGELPESVIEALALENVRDLETGESLNALSDSTRGGHIGQLRRLRDEQESVPKKGTNVPNEGTTEETPVRPGTPGIEQDSVQARQANPNIQAGTFVETPAPPTPSQVQTEKMRREETRRKAIRKAVSENMDEEQVVRKFRRNEKNAKQFAFDKVSDDYVRKLYQSEVAAKRPPVEPAEPTRVQRQGLIGETPENAAQVNKFRVRAQTILNQVFGGSADLANVIDKINRRIDALEEKLETLPSVARSDVEGIMSFFQDPRFRSLYDGQIEIPNDENDKRPLTKETAEFLINRMRGAINSMTRKDAQRRNERVRAKIKNVRGMLAGLRTEMEKAGIEPNLIDDILLDKEAGVENIIMGKDSSIDLDQEVALRNRLRGLNIAEKKVRSTDPLAKPISVDQIVNNAKLSADPAQSIRSDLARLGFENDLIDQVAAIAENEIVNQEFDDLGNPIERKAEDEFVDEGEPRETGDLFGDNTIIAAQFVDAIKSGDVNEYGSLDTIMDEAIAAGVGRIDILQELNRRGIKVESDDISLDGRPAYDFTLSGWMALGTNQDRNPTDLREDWLSSLDFVLNALKSGKAKATEFENGLREEEKILYKEWKKQRTDLDKRLTQRIGKEGANTYLFDNLEDAFPHALFNKFSLDQMLNPDKLDADMRRALQYTVKGRTETLPDLWFQDIHKVLNDRRDLEGDLLTTLSESEWQAYQDWRTRQTRIEMMRAKEISQMPEYNKLLQIQNDLAPEMYNDFVGRIVRAQQSERSAILHAAWEVAQQKRAAEAAKADVEAAENAVFDAIYQQDDAAESVLKDQNNEVEKYDREMGDPTQVDENGEPIGQIDENTTADQRVNIEAQVDLLRDKFMRFKTGRYSGVGPAVEIDNHLKALVKNWNGAPNFEVLSDVSQLSPEEFKYVTARLGRQEAKGVIMPNGKIYLFAKNLENIADAEFTFLHEVYGHYGLRGFLGNKFDAFLETQYKINKIVRAEADKLMAEAEATGRSMTQAEATEEAIADLAANNKEPGLFSQILAAIQKFLRSIGAEYAANWMESRSQAELAFVLSSVRKAVRNGEISPLNGAPDSVRFNADPVPYEIFTTNGQGRTSGYAVYNPFTNNWTVFYNPTGLDSQNFGIQVFDNYADAFALIKTMGKVIRVKNNPVRMDKMPGDFLKNPVPDFTKIEPGKINKVKAWMRKFQVTVFNKYKPVQEVVDYLRSQGVEVDLDRYLKLYNGRMKPYFDRFRLEVIRPISGALNKINESGFTYQFRGNNGNEIQYGGTALVGLYLNARHAKERNKEMAERNKKDGVTTNEKGSGLFDSEAAKILTDLRNSPIAAELDAIAALTDRLSKQKVNYALMTGLINEHEARNMNAQYQFYVNLSGNKDPDSFDFVDTEALGGQGFNVAGKDFKYASGRETIASEVLENTLNAYLSVIVRGQKNVVLQSLVRMVNNANDPNFGVINPITSAKSLDIEKLIQDKLFFATISNNGTVQDGREDFYQLKKLMQTGQMTPFDVATELQKRLDEALTQQRIGSKQHEALSDRLQRAITKNLDLGADGYVKEVVQVPGHKDPGAFLVKMGGKPVIVMINQGEDSSQRFGTFASALKGNANQGQSDVLEAIGAANRFIGQLLTSKNLTWVPINWFRDMGTAYANMASDPKIDPKLARTITSYSRRAYRVAINKLMEEDYVDKNGPVYRFLKKIFKTDLTQREKDFWTEYVNSGAPVFFQDRKDMKEQLAEMQRELSPAGGLEGTWEAYGKFADFVGIPSEMSVRFSAYMHLREAGWTKDEAAIYAKELTVNFEQSGSSRWIRSLFMFANPAIQGNIRMFRDAVVDGKLNPRFMKVALALAGLGAVANFIARAAGAGGEDDEEMPDSLDTIPRAKRATQIVLVPGMPFGAPFFLPYGWNVFYAVGQFLPDSMFFGTPASTTADRIASTAIDAFWPLGQSESANAFGTFVKMLTPTPFAPIVDIGMNESRFGGPITKENNAFVKAETSASWSNFSSSSPISTYMLRGLNELTGGNQYKSGWLDFNPDKLDYVAGAWLPGPISDTGRLVNTGINLAMGKDLKTVRLPLIDRFGSKDREDNPSWDAGAYRRAQTYVQTLYKEAQTEQGERKQEILKEHPRLGNAKAGLDAIDKNIRQMRTTLRAIESDPKRSTTEKVEARNHIQKLEQEYFARAVRIAMKTGFKDPVLSD